MPWKTMTLRGVKGSPLTNAEMDANLSTVLDFMNGVLLPQTAHDLNDYDVPGVYGQNATAGAVAGSNYPIDPQTGTPVAGVLYVHKGSSSDTSNISCQQEYKTYYNTNSTKFYRNRNSAGVWGAWVRIPKYDETWTTLSISTAQDANTLTTGNMVYTWTNAAVVTGGSNWPSVPSGHVGRGFLEVVAFSATQIYQRLVLPQYSTYHPYVFERYGQIGGTWTGWRIAGAISVVSMLPTADHGDVYVDGSGWYKWISGAYVLASVSLLLPSAAHDLNNYVEPGEWYQGSGSGATLANNYPTTVNGFLSVKQYSSASVQVYVTRETTPRTFRRTKNGATAWSNWIESVSRTDAVTRIALTAATDANTLTQDNKYYTWVDATPLTGTGAANWPPVPPATVASGFMETFYLSGVVVVQRVTLLVSGGRSREFERLGIGSAWEPWKMTSSVSDPYWLPTANCGDVYVDNAGWYRWNGTTYAPARTRITALTSAATLMDVAMGGLAANGAIIEQGSNANGIWIKFGDGTMLCVIATILNLTGASFTSNGAFSYFAVSGGIAIPAAFAGTPVIVAASFSDNDIGTRACYLGSAGIATTTAVSGMYLVSPNPSLGAVGSSGVLRYLLLGTWK